MPEHNTKRQGRPKSEEKHNLILHAASCLFVDHGFANTSMDNVAKASGVSKQTVYSHFDNKDALFKAAIIKKCQSYQLDTNQLMQARSDTLTLNQYLKQAGARFIRLIQDPETVAVFRLVIGEAQSTPHVSKLFYDAGPGAAIEGFSEVFFYYSNDALSKAQSAELATDFCSLLQREFHTKLLCGIQQEMMDDEISAHVEMAVGKTLLLFNTYCANKDK
ncbi:TetR/AcrR family transcriptional regulator [Alteromonas sp. 1_MG-2023]|uniref:TetR/AcrR family transcriptional regulator n=1 Tax=Alteromonas sp. 1_MG-2023 TaxID=3062669 RepID=UPI0026E28DCA|nr:TetR/AcrR family transcriptional regulator [Alteromonas sp. 1_MG-2023]MDO6567812.1 TetR/AcrR family transcriptional regulator [Alteromonas sp. 1_MG-2023]